MIDDSYWPMIEFGGRLAAAAYLDEAGQRKVADAEGLSFHAFHRIESTDTEFGIYRDVHRHVTHIVVRGTELSSFRDLRIDSMALRRRVIVQDTPLLVHRGYHRAILSAGGTIASHMHRFGFDEVWLYGHSMGGGECSQLRVFLPWIWRRIIPHCQPINCIRFASPRQGCPTYAAYSDAQPGIDIRVELEDEDGNTVDPICGVPGSVTKRIGPLERYRHAGVRVGLKTDARGFRAHPMARYNDAIAANKPSWVDA